ncbi:hypothetical protein AB1E18_009690 [Capra hircus]
MKTLSSWRFTEPTQETRSRNEVPRQEGNNFKSTKFASVLPTWTLEDATETCKGDTSPGDRNLPWGGGWRGSGSPLPRDLADPRPFHEPPFAGGQVTLPRRPSQIRPARPPAPLARRPANHSRSTQPSGLQGAGAGRPRAFPEPAPRGRGPGAPLVRLPRGSEWRRPAPQGHLRVRARGKPAEPRRRQPLAVGKRKMNLPPNGPVGGGCGRGGPRGPSRSRRSGGGYRSALHPIVSLPRGSRQSRAREPGSSPARHLLPPLWKRAPASQSGSPGTPPPSRRPRPPHGPPPTVAAAAAAAAILARPGRPLPGGTCALLPRVPAGRGGALPGPQGAGAASREAWPGAAPRTPREGERETAQAGLES